MWNILKAQVEVELVFFSLQVSGYEAFKVFKNSVTISILISHKAKLQK